MAELPSGVVTLLFGDIEGSTGLWEADEDRMRAALAAHDAVVETAIRTHDGALFKHLGDGFAAAFASPHDALAAAADIENRLRDLEPMPLRVRIGAHTGPVDPVGNDYFGPEVNRAARVMDAANGGQIVLSGATELVVRGAAPPDMTIVDAGEHRLKDLGEPIRIFRMLGAVSDNRPLRTLSAAPNNLPVQLSSFVGRSDEVRELTDVVRRDRLVTLTGIGGVGKTRLALQVAADLLGRYRDGVWMLELAHLTEPGLLATTTLTTMRLPAAETRAPIEQLIDELSSKELLLVVDNCEHLIDDVAKFVDQLLRAVPGLSVIATSREGLAVSGERLWRVPSLRVDDHGTAVELFAERARLVRPDFVIDDDNIETIVQLCRRLDGIPLAIELATARLKMLDVDQIAQHLDDRFRLLTGGGRTSVERQRTLLAMMDWSWGLLGDPEQTLLRRLATFVGGFDLTAAAAVAADDDLSAVDVFDLVGRLVETSMLDFEEEPEPRYRMLETVRSFGLDRLVEAGEADDVRRRHAVYFGSVADEIARIGSLTDNEPMIRLSTRELPNLRAAMTWAYAAAEPEIGLRVAVGLRVSFYATGNLDESLRWTGTGIDLAAGSTSPLAIRALAYSITDTFNLDWTDAGLEPLLDRARRIEPTIEDVELRADLVNASASTLMYTSPRRADRRMRQAIELYRQAGSIRWILPLTNRFILVSVTNDLEPADELLELLAIAESQGLRLGLSREILTSMLAVAQDRADVVCETLDPAFIATLEDIEASSAHWLICDAQTIAGELEAAEASRRTALSLDPPQSTAERMLADRTQAEIAWAAEDYDGALAALQAIRAIALSHHSDVWHAYLAAFHTTMAAHRGDPERVARLFGFWEQCSTQRGWRPLMRHRRLLEEAATDSRRALGSERFDHLLATGAGTDFAELPLYDA